MIILKRIENSSDTDLLSGISILQKYVPHNLCVDSNELIHWLDNYNTTFIDQMYCYVIKQDETVIGYVQFTHFVDNFIFFDYLIVEKKHRTIKNMKETYSLISSEMDKTGCKPIVLECGDEMNQQKQIIRLYESFGFKKFNIDYKEPKLDIGLTEQKIYWQQQSSVLMTNDLTLNWEDVVEIVYFNHYLRWYSLYKLDCSEYITFLKQLIFETGCKCKGQGTPQTTCIYWKFMDSEIIKELFWAWNPTDEEINNHFGDDINKIDWWR